MFNTLNNTDNRLNDTNLVYYFSGTGNSYYVAKTIANRIDAVLKPILSLNKGDIIKADILCFVFPVYDFKPPKKVTEVVENLLVIKANYTVAIGTYGVALSSTLNHFKKSLEKKGVTLSRGYGIKMPHNAIGSTGFTDEENSVRILKAEKKISDIVIDILAKRAGNVEKTTIFEDFTIFKKFNKIIKLMSILIFKGSKFLEFTVKDDCITCYLCKKICPVGNIELLNGKPVFGNECTSCFACLQWCPKSAIHVGKYSFTEIGIKHYQNPKVKPSDLILNKQGDGRL